MTKTPKAEMTTMATPILPMLLLAFELGDRTWKLGFTIGFGQILQKVASVNVLECLTAALSLGLKLFVGEEREYNRDNQTSASDGPSDSSQN